MELSLKGRIVICSLFVRYLARATHVLTDSSTALDRSPFLPPNLSIVLNLSFFSSSSGSSTEIRPILITDLLRVFPCFGHDSSESDILQIARTRQRLILPIVSFFVIIFHQFFSFIRIVYYIHSHL